MSSTDRSQIHCLRIAPKDPALTLEQPIAASARRRRSLSEYRVLTDTVADNVSRSRFAGASNEPWIAETESFVPVKSIAAKAMPLECLPGPGHEVDRCRVLGADRVIEAVT